MHMRLCKTADLNAPRGVRGVKLSLKTMSMNRGMSGRPHPPQSIGALAWQLSNRWKAAVERAVAPLGLSHGDHVVLAALLDARRRRHIPCQREVAEAVGLSAIFASKLLRGLEREGLVDRVPDAADSRAMRLGLSAEGLRVAEAARAAVKPLERQLAAPLGTPGGAKARSLAETLRALMAGLER